MKFVPENIVRKSLLKVKPYSTARDEFKGNASIFLDANENPYNTDFNRYPDPRQSKLKEAIAQLKNVRPQQIIIGNGSDEIIDLLIRAFCEPAVDNIIVPQPTYGMYTVCAAINNVAIRQPQLNADFDLDLSSIEKSIDVNSKIIFLCSPNNPSGNLLEEEKVYALVNSFPGLVVVDEAYIDFANTNGFLSKLDNLPNLIILQTFSKAWGLAGLRLGVGYASEAIIDILNKIKPPYNINTLSQQYALAALEKNYQKEETVNSLIQERTEMEKQLQELNIVQRVFPSQANFLLVRMDDAKARYNYLLSHGIIVRDRSSVVLCDNCLRITVGTPTENKALIQALKNI